MNTTVLKSDRDIPMNISSNSCFEFDEISNVGNVLARGFLPVMSNEDEFDILKDEFEIVERDFILAYYVNHWTKDEIEFWIDEVCDTEATSDHMCIQIFCYKSIEDWIKFAETKCESLPLFLYAPNKLYRSRRPHTDMSRFKIGNLSYVNSKPINLYQHELQLSDGTIVMAIPVTRYGKGMHKGLYYGGGEKYMGTFYYLEPHGESKTYLLCDSMMMFKNKYQCYLQLKGMLGCTMEEQPKNWVTHYLTNTEMYAKDLYMTPQKIQEVLTLWKHPTTSLDENISGFENVPEIPRYAGAKLGLYGQEDCYDQSICKLAVELKINCIILTDMVGSHQIITEVLDVRDRVKSFESLIYPDSKI